MTAVVHANARSLLRLLVRRPVSAYVDRGDGTEFLISPASLSELDGVGGGAVLSIAASSRADTVGYRLAELTFLAGCGATALPERLLERARTLPIHEIVRTDAARRVLPLGPGRVLRVDPSGFVALVGLDAAESYLAWAPAGRARTVGLLNAPRS